MFYNRKKGAQTMSEEAVSDLPEQVKSYYDKGVEAVRRANFEYAVELFGSALALKQDFAEARFYLWLSLWEQQKQHPNILKMILGKITALFLMLNGFSLQKGGKTWEAVYQFEKAMRADPSNTAILNAIADCLISDGQTANAVKILEGVPMIDNKNATALKKIAGLYKSMENYDKARAFYQATMQANPNDMDAEHGIKELDAIKTLKGSFENQ